MLTLLNLIETFALPGMILLCILQPAWFRKLVLKNTDLRSGSVVRTRDQHHMDVIASAGRADAQEQGGALVFDSSYGTRILAPVTIVIAAIGMHKAGLANLFNVLDAVVFTGLFVYATAYTWLLRIIIWPDSRMIFRTVWLGVRTVDLKRLVAAEEDPSGNYLLFFDTGLRAYVTKYVHGQDKLRAILISHLPASDPASQGYSFTVR